VKSLNTKPTLSQTSIGINVKKRRRNSHAIDPLGKFFLSYHPDGVVRWQGQVSAQLSPNRFRIQLFEWFLGEPSEQRVVSLSQMRGWSFYDSADAWQEDIRRKTGVAPTDSHPAMSMRIFVFTPSSSKEQPRDN
jgi:hypothetical protein